MKEKYIEERFRPYLVFGSSEKGKVDVIDGENEICTVTEKEAKKIIDDRQELIDFILQINNKTPFLFDQIFNGTDEKVYRLAEKIYLAYIASGELNIGVSDAIYEAKTFYALKDSQLKRYLAFYAQEYYPRGGMNDFIGDYNDINEAMDAIREKNPYDSWTTEWASIYDTITKQEVVLLNYETEL